MDGAERFGWRGGVHRWTGGVHRRLRNRISIAGPLAAFGVATTAVTLFVSTFAGGDATSGAGTAPVVLPGICSNCAGTPSPATTTPRRSSSERASRSTTHTTKPTQTPTLTATQPPPALLAPAPDTSPSMTVCPPPLPPTKPSKSKKPKGKPSAGLTTELLETMQVTRQVA